MLAEVSEGGSIVALTNENGDHITFECGEMTKKVTISVEPKEIIDNKNNCGMACILSRFENGVWKRSPARLKIGFEPTTPYTFEDWLSTYQTTGAASKKYLYTGDEGT